MQAGTPELTRLAEAVFRAAGALVAEFEQAAGQIALTKQQATVLRAIPATGAMAELAAACRIDPSNLTGVITRLEERGYAVRRPSAADRRTKVIDLTAAGRRALATFERQLSRTTTLATRLDAHEREVLIDLLDRLGG